MKILPRNLRYLILSFIIIVASFAFANSAAAAQYSHSCGAGGGTIITTVSTSPTPPFAANSQFQATAAISSTCQARTLNVTYQHNGTGTVFTIIPSTNLAQSGFIPTQYSSNITATTSGFVRFVTNVDEPNPPHVLTQYNANQGWTNLGTEGWEAGATVSTPAELDEYVDVEFDWLITQFGSYYSSGHETLRVDIFNGNTGGSTDPNSIIEINPRPSSGGGYSTSNVCIADYSPTIYVDPAWLCGPAPTLTKVNVNSFCFQNNDCEIDLDAEIDSPARGGGERVQVYYEYRLCTTYSGCNPTVYTENTTIDISSGEYSGLGNGWAGPAEPQIDSSCVVAPGNGSNTTVIVPFGMEC